MKLVKFSKDWADEFNCDGFQVFTDEDWADFEAKGNQEGNSFNMGFGTNEGWEEDDTAEDVFKYDLNVTDITDEEGATIIKLFGKHSYGIFPYLECFTGEEDYA